MAKAECKREKKIWPIRVYPFADGYIWQVKQGEWHRTKNSVLRSARAYARKFILPPEVIVEDNE